MGATSVTGVGLGAAWGNKGPGNGRDQFVPLLTPHVICAGQVALVGGAATVTFPTALTGLHTNYAILVTGIGTAAYVASATDTSGNFVSFAITGTGTDVVSWAVVSIGNNQLTS